MDRLPFEMSSREILEAFPLDAKTEAELRATIHKGSACLAWGLFFVTTVLCVFMGYSNVMLRDENTELRERMNALQSELEVRQAYEDSWVCTYDRNDKRSAQGLVKHCIRSVGF